MTISINFLKPLADLVEKYAPTIASSLFGPVGGIAVSLIESMFGIKPNDDPVAKIQADPDHDVKLKQLEETHKEALLSLKGTLAQVNLQNSESAREREVSIISKLGHPDHIMNFLAYSISIAFFAYAAATMLKFIQPDTAISTQLESWMTGLIGYYFAKSHQGK